jgi:MerR family transcriptional regulator, light-induced transcriptional regulator
MEHRASNFNPNSFPDVPLYNIQAVAASTGVPSITLRSWERRYGVPEPKRDPKGYRLYSERDIAVTRWLKERVREGVGISRAVNMLRVLERGELLPEGTPELSFESLQSRLLDAIARLDETAVSRVISEALAVSSVEDVSLQLLQSTLYRVGDLWADGRMSVTTEHVGSNLIRSHIAQLVRLNPPPLRGERIIVGCAPGEFHDIGALILALFLRRRGFDVVYAGSSVEAESLKADVQRLHPAAVCLSASTPQTARALATLAIELHGVFDGIVAFGGRAFNVDETLIGSIDALFLGQDARSAVARLDAALSRQKDSVAPGL